MYLAYAYCKVPVAGIMSHDSHRAEMVSQLLFGEGVFVIAFSNNQRWIHIISQNDNCEGWIITGQLEIIPYKIFRKPNKYVSNNSKDLLQYKDGSINLPFGSELPHILNRKFKWLPDISYKGSKRKLAEITSFGDEIINAAMQYFGAPYRWGGRTIMGIDCSGLVQMAYKLCNIHLPRNAQQQVEEGFIVDFLESAQMGDIAFFDDEEGNIIHTGLLIDAHSILHASETSGRVVIDSIDSGGIVNVEHKKRTHKLRVIKRIIASFH